MPCRTIGGNEITAIHVMRTPNILLIGPPACGKTALARYLAERLGREFLDSDDAVQKRAMSTVAEIFEREGERRFRQYETEAIAELTQKHGIVLATGGGAVLSKENRCRLRECGTVVYLRASVETQLARIGDGAERPLLKSRNKREVLEQLSRQRESHYRRIADIILSVDNKSICETSDELINILSSMPPASVKSYDCCTDNAEP